MDALIHFHILWFLPKYDGEDYIDGLGLQSRLYDSILENWYFNRGSKRVPVKVPLCTFKQSWFNGKLKTNYDTHFVQSSLTSDGISSVAFYVCKYMMKGNPKEVRLQQALRLNLSPEEYDELWDLLKSKTLRSSSFGFSFPEYRNDIEVFLHKGVESSKTCSPFPLYYSPSSHSTFPLSPYYKRFSNVYSMRDHLDFKLEDKSVFIDFDKTPSECDRAIYSFQRMLEQASKHDYSLDLNLFYE